MDLSAGEVVGVRRAVFERVAGGDGAVSLVVDGGDAFVLGVFDLRLSAGGVVGDISIVSYCAPGTPLPRVSRCKASRTTATPRINHKQFQSAQA